jgi:hypothetical protein
MYHSALACISYTQTAATAQGRVQQSGAKNLR